MIIKRAQIEKFRSLHNIDFNLGLKVTAIVGHNATMKTTLLGIISQTFSIPKDNPMYGFDTIDGYNFKSQLSEKFKLSEKDIPGEHKWKLELYPNIHKNDFFEAASMLRDKKTNKIRFWSTEGRSAGTGYVQIPVYYLSLKRVTPIGEEGDFEHLSELDEYEKKFLIKENQEIFFSGRNDYSIDTIKSKNKYTASVHQQEHDALAISAGQDNLGKILIAVLSFRRLQQTFGDHYKGGVLLIDEIESTFHPAAQQRLISRIYKYARDYKIQFIFTTHSPTVIKSAFLDKHNKKDSQLVYLKKVGDSVRGYENPEIDDVILELSGQIKNSTPAPQKISIFSEDIIARQFLSVLLKDYKSQIKFISCSIGAEEYLELYRVKLEPLSSSVIILDADKNTAKINTKLRNFASANGSHSIVFLPGQDCPEKMFYKFLYNLADDDSFWDTSLAGYDRHKCFCEYPTLIESQADTDQYKKWFDSQKRFWGRASSKLFTCWQIKNPELCSKFIKDFINAYNLVALKNNIAQLTIEV